MKFCLLSVHNSPANLEGLTYLGLRTLSVLRMHTDSSDVVTEFFSVQGNDRQ